MLTIKQQNFCMAYIETGNASEAYRQAYDAERMKPDNVRKRAFELLQHSDITGTIETLQAEQTAKHEVTVDTLQAELEEARQGAIESGQNSAAVAATTAKMKLYGFGVEKKETTISTDMSIEQANRILKEAGLWTED